MWELKPFFALCCLFKTGVRPFMATAPLFHLMILRCPSIYRILRQH